MEFSRVVLGSGWGYPGTSFSTIVPYRCFHTQDRDIAIAVGSDKLWPPFCRAIGLPDLGEDPRYLINEHRVKHRAILEPMFEEIFRTSGSVEWTDRMTAQGVPCTPVRTFKDVFEDPQAEVREMFPQVEHASIGQIRVTGVPA